MFKKQLIVLKKYKSPATTIFAPVMMTSLFAYFTSTKTPFLFPGAPFFVGAVLVLVSTWLAYRSMRRVLVKEKI